MENERVPELRFAGFSEKWDQCKLGDLSEKVTEKNNDNIFYETLTNSAEFGIITQRDFFEKDISNKKNLNGYYIVNPDYFVYNPRISKFAPVGPIKRNNLGRTGVMSPLYYVFRTYDVDKTYLEYYFSSNNWHRFMILNGDTGARSDRFAIKDSVFREMPIPTPLEEEQIKIGNFFKQLDNTIEFHEQELDTLKQTKQGFLQKMFPKEGESMPEIRFSGFNEKWKQYELGECVDFYSGLTYSPKNVTETGTLVLRSSNIKNGEITDADNVYVDSIAVNSQNVEQGDVIVVVRNGSRNLIGKHALVKSTMNNTVIGAFMTGIQSNAPSFINALLDTKQFNKEIHKNLGATINQITTGVFKKMKFLFPSISEQEKIGDFFKDLDDTIALHEQELETLKQTKKAFLQKMFI